MSTPPCPICAREYGHAVTLACVHKTGQHAARLTLRASGSCLTLPLTSTPALRCAAWQGLQLLVTDALRCGEQTALTTSILARAIDYLTSTRPPICRDSHTPSSAELTRIAPTARMLSFDAACTLPRAVPASLPHGGPTTRARSWTG